MRKYQPPQSHTTTRSPKKTQQQLMLFFAVGSLHVFEMSDKMKKIIKD